MKEITVDKILYRLDNDPALPWWGFGNGYNGKYEDTPKKQRCVLQQVYTNLTGDSSDHWLNLNDALNYLESELGTDIWHFNDDKASTFQQAKEYMKERLSAHKGRILRIHTG